jgi:hypothetical protein
VEEVTVPDGQGGETTGDEMIRSLRGVIDMLIAQWISGTAFTRGNGSSSKGVGRAPSPNYLLPEEREVPHHPPHQVDPGFRATAGGPRAQREDPDVSIDGALTTTDQKAVEAAVSRMLETGDDDDDLLAA